MPLYLARFHKNAVSSISVIRYYNFPPRNIMEYSHFDRDWRIRTHFDRNGRIRTEDSSHCQRKRKQYNKYGFRRVPSAEAIYDQSISDGRFDDEQYDATLELSLPGHRRINIVEPTMKDFAVPIVRGMLVSQCRRVPRVPFYPRNIFSGNLVFRTFYYRRLIYQLPLRSCLWSRSCGLKKAVRLAYLL